MTIQIARDVGPAHLDIAYERLGPSDAPPVLLIMGLGAQLVGWPDGFCQALVERGLHVIRFDNRDAGQSTHLHDAPVPDPVAALGGNLASAAYTLSDMAADTVGLLDVLGLTTAHVVGASLGGFIAQTIAIEHPARLATLTVMMSTTGDPTVGQPAPATLPALMRPPATTREEAIEQTVRAIRVVGSPGFEPDLAAIRARAERAYDRGHDPLGMMRQAVAVIASGDRTPRLRSVTAPALVIHGAHDPMVDVSGGRAIAEAIPGARLVVYEGMGHDLPRALWPQIADEIAAHVTRAARP